MRSVDPYFRKQFDRDHYNCLHFARDVWLDLTGVDITEKLTGLLVRAEDKRVRLSHYRSFTRLDAPVDPCLVLMTRPHVVPHAGVFVRGRVLHIHEGGVEFQPVEIAARGFVEVRYYL